jgi:hypothetical protein
MEASSRWLEAESLGARKCVPVDDKEEDTSSTTAPTKLEYAIRRKNTMHTLGRVQQRVGVIVGGRPMGRGRELYIKGNHCQGRLLISHLPAHLLQPPLR